MRRRGRSLPAQVIYSVPPGSPADYCGEPQLVISEVPEEWRKHAREPWRILFLDLEWAPGAKDSMSAPTNRWEPASFYCPACLPHELLGVILPDVASLPDDGG